MATLTVAPYITVTVDDTGDVMSNEFSAIGEYISTLVLNNMFVMNQKEIFGGMVYGVGNQNLNTSSYGVQSVNKLYYYFFSTTGTSTLDDKGILPSFMDYTLTIDDAKLIAYACNVTTIDTSKTKQGITKEREGLINTLAPIVGCTCYWPAGYGTGEINAFAVSLVDLSTLKTLSTSTAQSSVVYAGVLMDSTSNYDGYKNDWGCIKPGITNITGSEEMLIKIGGTRYKYNLSTGVKTAFTDTWPAASDFAYWGANHVVLDSKLYCATQYGDTQYRIKCLDLTAKTTTYGSAGSTPNFRSSAVLVGTDIYFETARTTSTITLTKLDTTNLYLGSTTITVNLPTYFATASRYGSLTQFSDGAYGLIDKATGVCYKFTDLANISTTITEVFFTGCTYDNYPVLPIDFGTAKLFLGITINGFMESSAATGGKNSGQYKLMLTDGRCGPLLSYNKFETTYNKTATSELTSSFMITASSLV